MRKTSTFGALFLAASAVSGSETSHPPTALFLEPLAEGVARGVSDEKCIAELQAALGGRKLRVVATPDEASVRLEVRDCVVQVLSRVATKAKQTGGEIRGPQPGHRIIPGGARAVGQEHEYGATTEDLRQVLLVVRLSVGDRFAVLSSDPRDERLKQAAATVAKHAKSWLSESRLPAPDPNPSAQPGKLNERRVSSS